MFRRTPGPQQVALGVDLFEDVGVDHTVGLGAGHAAVDRGRVDRFYCGVKDPAVAEVVRVVVCPRVAALAQDIAVRVDFTTSGHDGAVGELGDAVDQRPVLAPVVRLQGPTLMPTRALSAMATRRTLVSLDSGRHLWRTPPVQ
jgi:hypothetical protein